jgi:hypothetical protein
MESDRSNGEWACLSVFSVEDVSKNRLPGWVAETAPTHKLQQGKMGKGIRSCLLTKELTEL